MPFFLYNTSSHYSLQAIVGIFVILIQQKTVTKFIVTVSAWQLVPTRLFALGFRLG